MKKYNDESKSPSIGRVLCGICAVIVFLVFMAKIEETPKETLDTDTDTVIETTDESSGGADVEAGTTNNEVHETDVVDSTTSKRFPVTPVEVDLTNKNYITSKASFVSKVSELVDISLYENLETIDESKYYQMYEYKLKSTVESSNNLDYWIGLGDGTEFTMPITFKELEKKGWSLKKESKPNEKVSAGIMSYGYIENAQGKELFTFVYNPSNKKKALKECTVIGVTADQIRILNPVEKLAEAIDVAVCDSVTNASTLEDIIRKMGNPTIIDYTVEYDNGKYSYSIVELYYEQSGTVPGQLYFRLSADGNFITAIHYQMFPA